jgi:hypothetical protein
MIETTINGLMTCCADKNFHVALYTTEKGREKTKIRYQLVARLAASES